MPIHWVCFFFALTIDYLIDGQLKSVIEHSGDKLAKQWAGALDTWVFVDLNQPHFVLAVNYEIESKYLEAVFALITIYFLFD